MIRFLTTKQIIYLQEMLINQSGGSLGIRDKGALESAVAQPQMTFGGEYLYTTIVEKAAALSYPLIQNHPFIDGNKRIGHAAMEVFLLLNGYEVKAEVNEQEEVILNVASSSISREAFVRWLKEHIVDLSQGGPA
jgi:death on curing protein